MAAAKRVSGTFVAGALLLTGCAAAPPQAPSPVTSSPRTPVPGGRTLAQFGVRNGPAELALPPTTQPELVVDQENVVTLQVSAPDGAQWVRWFATTVEAEGFTITARGQNSVLFENEHWRGAVLGGDHPAITLRSTRQF